MRPPKADRYAHQVCKAENEPGGPKRCSADVRQRLHTVSEAADEQTNHNAALTIEDESLARRIELLELVKASVEGGLTAEQQQRHAEIVADYDTDQHEDQHEGGWELQVIAARADVDQAWADAESLGAEKFVRLPEYATTEEQIADWMAAREQAFSRYEQAVLRVGAILGEEADRRAAERINDVEPDNFLKQSDLNKLHRAALEARREQRRGGSAAAAQEAVNAYNAAADRYNSQPRQVTAVGRMRARVYREVIGGVRELGGARPAIGGRPGKEVLDEINTVADDMPAEWVQATNRNATPMTLSRRKNIRGSYDLFANKITTGGGLPTAYHEYAHALEIDNPAIHVAANEFLRRRTTNADGTREQERPYGKRGSGEKIRADGFVDGYIGKSYSGASTEVFSVGTEAVFTGKYGGLVGDGNHKADLEHRNLILGLYATAPGRAD
ncbi:hypothetical protein GOOTI_202_00170 [Gordonia otitidis NBRC 100426]|uniref:Uncharacterized protein n=1 Tax=Gordonia otitidis (strain DSM 44809 / CCUG 52243 / JCM 12355 / NBRC 100426 / IFM 10032) TaxID=1108044 RepID=H5TRQ3_GORO1|nr:hypothetical protein GOOTI_202_00170 [Gordonia otitidis NBRC 100426]